jgi:Mce-associated membrane protein
VVEQRAPASDVETPEPEAGPGPETAAEAGPAPDGGTRPRRTTAGLVAAIVLLLLVGAGEVFYLLHDPTPAVSAERPVVTGELTHRAAVETAARSTEEILSTSYQDYDKQVDQATEKMTGSFAKEYKATAEGIRSRFLAQKTQLQVKAVAQGVVQASPKQVQALLFLNQYVQKVDHGKSSTSYAQYRALVTVVRTEHGWLVSDLQTQ